jgi:hypothetical protein
MFHAFHGGAHQSSCMQTMPDTLRLTGDSRNSPLNSRIGITP